LQEWNFNAKFAAFARFRLTREATIVSIDNNLVANRQPQTCAFAHWLGGEERVKEAGSHRFWHSGAIVYNPNDDRVVDDRSLRANGNRYWDALEDQPPIVHYRQFLMRQSRLPKCS
jgi:hypothetical protein